MLVRGADLWRFVHGVARRCCALQVQWLWWRSFSSPLVAAGARV